MWYQSQTETADQYWEAGVKHGYAVSKDGIDWEKPIMNMVEINGSTENNCLFPPMLCFHYTIITDPSDVPARRYKMVFLVQSNETRWAKFHVALNLAYSADGVHWGRPVHVNPVLRGVSDWAAGFIYDPDRRKYLLFTRRVPTFRVTSRSMKATTWSTGKTWAGYSSQATSTIHRIPSTFRA
jgi:hypothetical protein